MKKEFVTGHRVLITVMALLPLMFFWQMVQGVQAAADYQISEKEVRDVTLISGKRLMKTIPLDAEVVTQIPKYIVEEDTPYVLDESSIVVEETGKSSSEGADVVTTSRKVEKLPDNDLERIEKAITYEGIDCDLLYVIYEVTGEDEDGIPIEYSAVCEYGGLEKYSISYPSAWQATIWYDAYEITEGMEISLEQEEYEYTDRPIVRKTRKVQGENRAEEEEKPVPKPEVKKFILKKITPKEEEKGKILDVVVPLAAAALGTGLLLPFIIWFFVLTAPLFTLKKGEKYRYIGQIRLKKEESMYVAYLTKRLISKAEFPVFKIKVPEKVRKKVKAGVLQIHCPDGKRIVSVCGKEVKFTLERD